MTFGMPCFVTVIALTLVAGPAFADAAKREQLVREGQALWRVPGMATAFIDGDDVQFVSVGKTRRVGGTPITADTAFAIASTTKAMVAAAMAILVDRGRLAWSDPVSKYFPRLRFHDAYIDRHARVIDLLTHSLGVPSTDAWAFLFDVPFEERIERFRKIPSTAAYRERFQYQNSMYDLAGELIGRVSGKPWHDFVRDELWLPLEMKRTYPNRAAAKASGGAHVEPHHYVGSRVETIEYRPLREEDPMAAGSVWSTAADMARWAQFLLRKGVTKEGRALISAQQFSLLFEPHVLIARDDFYPTVRLTKPKWRSYGLGWFQQDYRGQRIDFHTGSLGGLSAIVGLNRDENRAVVVLENLDHAEVRHAIMWAFFDPSRDWNTEVKALYDEIDHRQVEKRKVFEASRRRGTRPSWPLEAYTGTYRHHAYGSFEVYVERGELYFKSPLFGGRLDHWHYNTFMTRVAPWAGQQPVRFELEANGEVHAMVAPPYFWAKSVMIKGLRYIRRKKKGAPIIHRGAGGRRLR